MSFFPIKLLPEQTSLNFLGKRWLAFVVSIALIVATIACVSVKGLNFGIDFTGGILIEAEFQQKPDLKSLRSSLKKLNVGDISLQTFGKDNNLLIRVGNQAGSEKDRLEAVKIIKNSLAEKYDGIDYRKVDYVGPKVGKELVFSGAIALILAFAAIMVYIWFRFEWQYGAGAVVALIHDAFLTVGFFSITQLEFNLSSIAAILTIIGYSINDSVVIFDRIRENVRRYKAMPLEKLLNTSINNNLNRTVLTSLTTMFALLALVVMGGEVIKSFSMAALFGVIVGTYSSIYVASPVLIYMGLRPANKES